MGWTLVSMRFDRVNGIHSLFYVCLVLFFFPFHVYRFVVVYIFSIRCLKISYCSGCCCCCYDWQNLSDRCISDIWEHTIQSNSMPIHLILFCPFFSFVIHEHKFTPQPAKMCPSRANSKYNMPLTQAKKIDAVKWEERGGGESKRQREVEKKSGEK